jgi:putative membrane protein insertion efficiency factor
MPALSEKPVGQQRPLSPLRKRLTSPWTWLLIFFSIPCLALADSFRKPGDQVTARLYVLGVRGYQAVGRPLLRSRVRCRYTPTCSEYSIEAVETHGIRYGLVLTYRRIASCTHDVPLDTPDPVPPPDDPQD